MKLPRLEESRLLVVGDVMLDRYWTGDTSRVSPEAPVPVVRVCQVEERCGGAANVALNIASLGAQVTVMGFVGEDDSAYSLERDLQSRGVVADLEHIRDGITVIKLRILSRHQQLIRLDFENGFAACSKASLLARFRQHLPKCDVVVLSDYGKGTLSDPAQFIAAARQADKPVLVDPKGRDFNRYRGATLLTPNLMEFENTAGHCDDEDQLVERAQEVCAASDLEALVITRGDRGITLVQRGAPARHYPANAREVFDVTGAGDTVIAVLAAALAADGNLPNGVDLANLAAGLVVGKLGAASVTVPELERALHGHGAAHGGVVSEEQLMALVAEARRQGQTLVMTNGCFDILHAGHVSYLERAKSLGDRLIVAVNDDASVRGLKGPDRPVNSVEQRMKVLAALSAVDWVVPFREATPERLIIRVSPDILVKGGDYMSREVAGHEHVTSNGGQVIILDYEPGCSTSAIIARVQSRGAASRDAEE